MLEIKNEKSKNGSLLEQLSGYLDPSKYDTKYLTHGIHPYPAKYIPQLPRAIIQEHTNERNTILDPFCGSGTTLLEACLLGRKSIGIDSNPIATLISRAKTQALSNSDISSLCGILEVVKTMSINYNIPECTVPDIPKIEHWFQENVIKELAWLKNLIENIKSERLRDFLFCIFSSIIVSVSNQESETRYAAVDKNIVDGYVLKRFNKKLQQELDNIIVMSKNSSVIKNTPTIFNADSRDIDQTLLADNSIDLVVTSPPYANSFDYYLYHKFRMYWLGYDPSSVKQLEIGSRNEHSSRKADIDVYIEKMYPVIKNVARVLKPSKLAYFFIGDSIISQSFFNMKEIYGDLGERVGLKLIADTDYSLDKVSRSFYEKRSSSNKNTFDKRQRILVFQAINSSTNHFVPKRVKANPKSQFTQISLEANTELSNGSIIAISSDDNNRHIHSLGKYPSKFFPEIPRWAINQFSNKGDTVFDPFMGSGTTAVEAVLASRNVIGTDLSPYACLLSVAKTTREPSEKIIHYAKKINEAITNKKLPKVARLEFEKDDFWFNIEHLEEIESIRKFIILEVPAELQTFFLGVLSTVIKKCSYLDESQIKVKRDPKKVLNGTKSPLDLLSEVLFKNVERLIEFTQLADKDVEASILNVNSAELSPDLVQSNSVDLVVTSPPYINAMNYPMTHRYENILLHLIEANENISHQTHYLGTERVYAKDYNKLHQIPSEFSYSSYLNPRLEQIFNKEPKRSYIAYKYFLGMYETFKKVYSAMKPGAKFVLVAGTNNIKDIHIDTFKVLVSFLEDIGLKYVSSFHYEIIKNSFKLTRHETADLIKLDGVAVLEK